MCKVDRKIKKIQQNKNVVRNQNPKRVSNHQYSPNDIVWAKLRGFPFWPAQVLC